MAPTTCQPFPLEVTTAIVFGHTHSYSYDQANGIHLINIPAVGYNFTDAAPVGWVEAGMTQEGSDLTLRGLRLEHFPHRLQNPPSEKALCGSPVLVWARCGQRLAVCHQDGKVAGPVFGCLASCIRASTGVCSLSLFVRQATRFSQVDFPPHDVDVSWLDRFYTAASPIRIA